MPIVCAGASVPNSTALDVANPSTAAHPSNERARRRSTRSDLDVSLMSIAPDLEDVSVLNGLTCIRFLNGGRLALQIHQRRPSPNLVAEPAVLRRPRDEPDTPFNVPPCTSALTLRLHISLCRRTRSQWFGIGCSKLGKCLAHARLWKIGVRRGAELNLSDVGRHNRGPASVENDPLGQFPIGMDADGGGARSATVHGRPIRHQGIRNEEHREQGTADIEQIS